MRSAAFALALALWLGACSAGDDPMPAGWVRTYGVTTEHGTNAIVPGFKICLLVPALDHEHCTTSAADGSYTLYVPPNERVAATYQKDGYVSEIELGVTTTDDVLSNFAGLPVDQEQLLATLVGDAITPGMGQVVLSAFGPGAFVPNGGSPGFPGVTFALDPPAAGRTFYANDGGVPDPTLTSTTSSALAGILNVAPGPRTAIFTAPAGHACTNLGGWPDPDRTDAIDFILAADGLTHISATCR